MISSRRISCHVLVSRPDRGVPPLSAVVSMCPAAVTVPLPPLPRCSPLGIASIICGKILAVPQLGLIMEQLGLFIVTVVVGVFIYQLVIMQLIYLAIVRRNPWPFFWHMREAWLTVFATAST